ncbi:hypothetical protein FACS1894164_16350 [Spirochaetia bacterium]|nr:hypothetical protein FACS1894164_16350 [Spirochaetia bacterium]
MPPYSNIQKEETLKAHIFADFFGTEKYDYDPNIDNIDFVITDKKTRNDLFSDGIGNSKHYLWAESKKGVQNIESMLTQLILTCRKTYEKGEYLAPPWIGCFDTEKIAFVPFYDILSIFNETDINWNTAPSNHESSDFQKAQSKIVKLVLSNLVVYHFDTDEKEIKEFIKTHLSGGISTIKSPITKDNFVQIFIKWVKEIKPFINISKEDWTEFKKNGVLDCDFFRADMMSSGGNTITEKLKIILRNDNYKFQAVFGGRLFASDIDFTDGGTTYKRFWNKYERLPVETYITERRDLLVPENIRERKGSFFTPSIWVKKSQAYISKVFGADWQDEYYVWDCAAGTGNLLAGLTNKYNVWASDIDEGNVETIQSLIDIDENLNLLPSHVFQFDFLNDDFNKLPVELKKIIDEPEKRKKLIVYINPPYAEASSATTVSGTGKNKIGVAQSKTKEKYKNSIGKAVNELFAQFLARIHGEISRCSIGCFSTPKFISGSNFKDFRSFFTAGYKDGFVVPAWTFDNVTGKFPDTFTIWDTDESMQIGDCTLDIFNEKNELLGKKTFFVLKGKTINNWIVEFKTKLNETIGNLCMIPPDFQHSSQVFIVTKPLARYCLAVAFDNVIPVSINFAVRHVFDHTWLNHNDQFLYPTNGYKTDTGFQNDCLIYMLFHSKNSVQSHYGINHWIPFTEKQIDTKERFESHFMSDLLREQAKNAPFSTEATAVLDAGLELWKYYHAKIKNNRTVSVNASFYDIREFFQGHKDSGVMKTTSEDEIYNRLIAGLREKLRVLTKKIQPKVYEYGFLKE